MRWSSQDTRLAACAAVAPLLAYLPALGAGFVSDDFLILQRIQAHGGLHGAPAYFSLNFFDYYRPLAFLSHAADWAIWGTNPFGFHLTNVLLHAIAAALVFAAGRQLAGRTAGLLAALLFGLHPANTETVFWVAARFDLLATGLALAAFLCLIGSGWWWRLLGAAAFLLALLSKESVVALPVATAAYDLFAQRMSARRIAARLTPLVAALVIYAALRAGFGDLAMAGGGGRLGKALMLAGTLGVLLLIAARLNGARWIARPLAWQQAAVGALVVTAALGLGVLVPPTSGWIIAKLTFIAYATVHLLLPVGTPAPPPYFLDPGTPVYWVSGLVAVLMLTFAILKTAHAVTASGEASALFGFIIAALIPVSTLTGGTRYLYLASVGVSLLAGVFLARIRPEWRRLSRAALIVFLVLSVAQILAVSRTWRWAGRMTADAVRVLTPLLEPCGTRQLLLVTAPVDIGGVYSNLNEELFSVLGACPGVQLRTVSRVVRSDARVEAIDEGPGRIGWRVPDYAGNVIVSADLRHFDVPLRASRQVVLQTPIGRLESRAEGSAQRFSLVLDQRMADVVLAYYSEGSVRPWPKAID